MNQKPILFLDFDRTLFDTERYYEWLGEPRRERNQALIDGTLILPDFSQFLFFDSSNFLVDAQKMFTLVILSFVKLEYSDKQAELQKQKIKGSGVQAYCSDVIVTTISKADEARKFLEARALLQQKFAFVDDEPKHLSDMKRMAPNSVCIQLKREGKMTGVALDEGGMNINPDAVVSNLVEASQVFKSFFR